MNWNSVETAGLSLPAMQAGTSYGRPALKLNGKLVACAGRADDHFVLMLDHDRVDFLLAFEPDQFFQTPHYVGWPCILVRYAGLDPDDLHSLLSEAWERRATAKQRSAHM